MAMCVGKGMQRSLANSYTLAKSCECLTLKWAMSSRLGPGMRAFHEIIIHTISSPALRFKGLDKKVLDIDIQGAKALSQCIVSKSWFQLYDTLFGSHNNLSKCYKSYQTTQEMTTTSISTEGRMSRFKPWLSPGPPGGLHCDQNRHRPALTGGSRNSR